jgi:hypothetical protein
MLASSGSLVGAYIVFGVVGYLLIAFAYFGIFRKADQPVWAAFVPIVNIYFLLKTVGRPWWWLLLLLFVPCLNVIFYLIVAYDLSRSFGHGVAFWIGLIFLSIIFLYILSYGRSEYRGAIAALGGDRYVPPPPAVAT